MKLKMGSNMSDDWLEEDKEEVNRRKIIQDRMDALYVKNDALMKIATPTKLVKHVKFDSKVTVHIIEPFT